MTERIIGQISQAEAQKDNVAYLDATVPLLSRRLLYEQPTQENEIAGYRYLRGLTSNPDETVRDVAEDALDKRWEKVGFYQLHTPTKLFSSIRENDRVHFCKAGYGSGSGVKDDAKVAVLELARRREPMTTRQFEYIMTPLIGLQKDFPSLVTELKKLYVLTDETQYIPVVESTQGKIRMTEGAYSVLVPHLPVLEAISYPEQVISEQEKTLALALGREVDRILRKSAAFFTEDNIRGLTLSQQRGFFLANLGMLEVELKDKRIDRRERRWDEISFLVEEGKLCSISHNINSTSDYVKESVIVNVYQQPVAVREQLTFDFWGRQIIGKELGKFGVNKSSRGLSYIEASGDALISALPNGLKDADGVTISAEGMTVSWEDVSERKKDINFDVSYQKLQEGSTPRRFGETFITAVPTGISVPETYKSKLPRRKKKAKDDDSYLFRGSNTIDREIIFNKDEDVLELRHPKGRYTLAYKKVADGIHVTFTGRGWNRDIIIPVGIDPVSIAQSVGQQLETMMQRAARGREAIKQQIANTKQMTLADQFRSLRTNDEQDRRLKEIDQSLAQLDPDTQWYAKYYMKVLIEMRSNRPIEEKVAKDLNRDIDDPREQFRRIINEHGILIPEQLLLLAEEIFMPEEYRNQ